MKTLLLLINPEYTWKCFHVIKFARYCCISPPPLTGFVRRIWILHGWILPWFYPIASNSNLIFKSPHNVYWSKPSKAAWQIFSSFINRLFWRPLTLFYMGGGKNYPPTLKSAVMGRKSENFQKLSVLWK